MKFAHWRIALPAAAIAGGVATPALAQRPPSPQQQIVSLQQQLAASQASAFRMEQRLNAIERQLQQIIAMSEQTGHRINVVEQGVQQIRNDQDSRISALERAVANLSVPQPSQTSAEQPLAQTPAPATTGSTAQPPASSSTETARAADPGEDAYSEGYHLWNDGKYDQAITALRAFTSAYPKHRRVSWANNLVGRALLDKGQPRPAAEAFLANYRSNPQGGRAQDSLYYLGQALMKLGQPDRACNAYAELTSVYGANVRADLRPLIAQARAAANCS